jgi:hypothetical protein
LRQVILVTPVSWPVGARVLRAKFALKQRWSWSPSAPQDETAGKIQTLECTGKRFDREPDGRVQKLARLHSELIAARQTA